jgi:hypothetical protein
VNSDRSASAGRVRLAVSLLGYAIAPCLLAACGSDPASLAAPGLGSGGDSYGRVEVGHPVSIGFEGTICLDKPGNVIVTGITPVQPHRLRVIDFALRPNENWRPTPSPLGRDFLGMDARSLDRLGFKGHIVDAVCHPNTGSGYEPAVRVVKTAGGEATSAGWTISYTSGGHTGTFHWPLALDLCPGAC